MHIIASAQNGQYFRIGVTYRFGKLKASVKKTETTIENSDEVGGITKGKKITNNTKRAKLLFILTAVRFQPPRRDDSFKSEIAKSNK